LKQESLTNNDIKVKCGSLPDAILMIKFFPDGDIKINPGWFGVETFLTNG